MISHWAHDALLTFKGNYFVMLNKIKPLINENDICVLATTGADGPHTSLMAYICSTDCTEIYLVTSVNTLKYRNLTSNAKVSLLVDTRDKEPRQKVRALTIKGKAHVIEDTGKIDSVRSQIQKRHAHLQGLLDQPDIAFICVSIEIIQMQNGVHSAHFVRMPDTNDTD